MFGRDGRRWKGGWNTRKKAASNVSDILLPTSCCQYLLGEKDALEVSVAAGTGEMLLVAAAVANCHDLSSNCCVRVPVSAGGSRRRSRARREGGGLGEREGNGKEKTRRQ